ncbi:hypothetical protein [Chitiniphilus eburneus]|uniref:SMP-30/Gluconolactonase/LRE-like region domain-containing protein n=1 Tax=Chitiniphilus eburneus TaxID=2571148 RepID=A0A4U0Q5W7_9NEIS|nr:hypothetical protein [Chitiniphilus eburneus]TJZ76170.1 hypothetical protein FAZ21_05180 [Chitiniphilus eburneus]
MKSNVRLKPILVLLAFCGALGLAACGGDGDSGNIGVNGNNGGPPPASVSTPVPTPTPPTGWISYNPAGGTVWYDTVTGALIRQGSESCVEEPVALDVRPSDGMLMGMSSSGKLMALDTLSGQCNVVDLGDLGTQLANLALVEPIHGFAVNPDGVYAVLADDLVGHVLTFKEGDSTFKSSFSLQRQPLTWVDYAFGIDFMDTGDTSRLIVVSLKLLDVDTLPGTVEARWGTHMIRYNPDGTYLDDSVGGHAFYYTPDRFTADDIAIANGVLYIREGNATADSGSPPNTGYLAAFDPLTQAPIGEGVLFLDQGSGTNLSNEALAVRLPAGD